MALVKFAYAIAVEKDLHSIGAIEDDDSKDTKDASKKNQSS